MSYSRRSRYSRSPSFKRSVSRSLSRSRSRSRSPSSDVENPGNNLYVTGLSPRITRRELEKHFSAEGTVLDVHLLADPLTRESRGFGFITMSSNDEAENCIKYLNRSVLEGRIITVEKARRRRGRTPTPGRYLGLRTVHGREATHLAVLPATLHIGEALAALLIIHLTVAGVDPVPSTDIVDHMVPLTIVDHTLIAGEDMILHTIGDDMILQTTIGIIGHILDPAHRIGGGAATGHTHLMITIPLILTTEGTGTGQFLGAFHQSQGTAGITPEVTLLSPGEER
ncbi:serine/arginine-rich splicing factor SR45a-like [Cucumis melo var. makuwa]|uniref:Serine/arginine-rich splicing factor SR45a-like n=1 Tax=Cucumis melo var. makuwa TaxID=1194695 RepID=A0A5D3BFE7_CUCMM|nr:serine/arginine-rich splicing factor SR45a-like [Cucumis melo var. makuwa]